MVKLTRPNLFLVCRVKVPDLRRQIVVPLPLWVLADLLQAGGAIWRLAGRFWPELSTIMDNQRFPGANAALAEMGRLLPVLRDAGPFTLVEVDQPADGVHVSVRLI